MILESFGVSGFRAIKSASIDCRPLTAILGRNGAGKSTFLHALDVFFDVAARVSQEDFYDRDTSQTIEIRATFTSLRGSELEEFASYVQDGKLIVTKRLSFADGKVVQKYFAATPQILEFAEIRKAPSKTDRIAAWKRLVDSEQLPRSCGRCTKC